MNSENFKKRPGESIAEYQQRIQELMQQIQKEVYAENDKGISEATARLREAQKQENQEKAAKKAAEKAAKEERTAIRMEERAIAAAARIAKLAKKTRQRTTANGVISGHRNLQPGAPLRRVPGTMTHPRTLALTRGHRSTAKYKQTLAHTRGRRHSRNTTRRLRSRPPSRPRNH